MFCSWHVFFSQLDVSQPPPLFCIPPYHAKPYSANQSLLLATAAPLHRPIKLENGQLVSVPPVLIRRLKQHMVSLPDTGVDVILGTNGNVWISSKFAYRRFHDMLRPPSALVLSVFVWR